jgi:cytochrome P450
VWVTRWHDIRSVMERPEDFSVRLFAMRMSDTTGNTFLGMDPSDAYRAESSAFRAALEVPDPRPGAAPHSQGLGRLDWTRRFAADLASRQVSDALKRSRKNEIDVVNDLADVVPLSFAREFFGTPEPDPPEILDWFKAISFYVFSPGPYHWATAAKAAGRSAANYFTELVRRRHAAIQAGQATPDDVLGRLIAAQAGPNGLPDEAIARCLSFVSGAMMPTSWLFIEAVDRLMRLPHEERERLHRLALEGDRVSVRAYVIEAARYFPFPYVIIRYAEREARIGGKRVSPGANIHLVIGSAALDRRAVPRPRRFEPGRPESQYMLFGHDVHLCMGKDIAEEIMTEMAIALFSRANLRRAPGPRGYIRYLPDKKAIPYGPYPASFVLRADG